MFAHVYIQTYISIRTCVYKHVCIDNKYICTRICVYKPICIYKCMYLNKWVCNYMMAVCTRIGRDAYNCIKRRGSREDSAPFVYLFIAMHICVCTYNCAVRTDRGVCTFVSIQNCGEGGADNMHLCSNVCEHIM